MGEAGGADGSSPGTQAVLSVGAIPSPLGARALGFVFLALVEYWVAPVLFGVTNGAGVWATLGVALFAIWTSVLVVFVLVPVLRRLRALPLRGRNRWMFHGTWAGGLLLGLLVTNTFQSAPVATGVGWVQFGTTTVYTPFGAWPTLTFVFPTLGVAGFLNVVFLTVLGILGVLSASILVLARERSQASCAPGSPAGRAWKGGVASFVLWTPLGLLSGCSACTPLYLGLLGVVAPGAAATGYSFLPFAPWGGFAGLVYLGSVTFAILVLHRVAAPLQNLPPFAPERGSSE